MITTTDYFENDISDITELLTKHQKELLFLKRGRISNYLFPNIINLFNDIFRTFPYEIETASDRLAFSYYPLELFDLFYEIDFHKELKQERIEQSKKRFKQEALYIIDKFLISDLVEDYFHSIILHYSSFI